MKFKGFPPKQKVLDYILRHTWGFDKNKDEISLSQLQKGIKNFDSGTGLSRRGIIYAINGKKEGRKGLIKMGFIKKRKGKYANSYELVTNLHHPSATSSPVPSVKSAPTIDNYPIDNTNSVSLKDYPSIKDIEKRSSK